MKMLVLGATGRTGKRVLETAARTGHQVVAIARDPSKLPDSKVEIIQGSPYDEATVERAVTGCDAVVNVLNVSRESDSPWATLTAPPDMISRSCANALKAMEKAGVKRYVTLSTVGAGESWKLLPWVVRLLVKHSNLKAAFDDHSAQEALLARSNVDYTVARAPMLNDADNATGVMAVKPGEKMKGKLSRQSAAEFLVSIIESGQYRREIIHVSNRG
jgi:uncharacterized protein YbjT (DUF2867 family)